MTKCKNKPSVGGGGMNCHKLFEKQFGSLQSFKNVYILWLSRFYEKLA